jgi:hypothetical protein
MNLKGMASIVSQLRAQRADFVDQITHVDAALALLRKLNGTHVQGPVRTMSAAGRKRIAAAQRARWARARGKAKVAPKRTMSARSRAKIAAAQRARWKKFRAEQKN